jgi:FtsZ-interacting cell division protein ZipA
MDLKFIIIIIMLIGIGLLLIGELHTIRKEVDEKFVNLNKEMEKSNLALITKLQNDSIDTINKIKNYNDELAAMQYKKIPSIDSALMTNVSHNHYSDSDSNKFKVVFSGNKSQNSSQSSIKKSEPDNIIKITLAEAINSPKPGSPKQDSPKQDSPKQDSPKPGSPKPESPKPESDRAPDRSDFSEAVTSGKISYNKLKLVAKQYSVPITYVVDGVRKHFKKDELYEKVSQYL